VSLPPGFAERCAAVVGPDHVLGARAELEPYATDFWRHTRGEAALVLRPRDTAEVAAVVALAAGHRVPLVPQAGNTGLVGGGVPDASGGQVVLSLARLDRVRAVDPAGDALVAEAGCTLASVQAAAEAADRLFPLSLGSEGTCRIGGNLAANAGGINVIRYGMARDLCLGLEVVLADGRVWNGLRTLRKDNTGYDLKQLFLGSEGTLGVVTAASLRLFPRPRERATLFLGVDSPATAVELLGRARGRFGELVSAFELIVATCVEAAVEHVPGVRFPLAEKAPWYVLAEVAWSLPEGLEAAADAWLEAALEDGLILDATRAQSEAQRAMLWRMREGISEAATRLGAIARHDVAVPVARIPELVERGAAVLREVAPDAYLIPFGHVGDGNLHFNVVLPRDTADLPAVRQRLQTAVFDLVGGLGGSISAEHGIGRAKRAELHARKPALDLELMGRLKAALDPEGILNPGVIV
jgi:FAD/FMN-containing dehydrogenase